MQDLTKNLTKKWRGHANTFQRFNEQGIATAFSTCADELEAAVSVRGDELLTLEEASQRHGASPAKEPRMPFRQSQEGGMSDVYRKD